MAYPGNTQQNEGEDMALQSLDRMANEGGDTMYDDAAPTGNPLDEIIIDISSALEGAPIVEGGGAGGDMSVDPAKGEEVMQRIGSNPNVMSAFQQLDPTKQGEVLFNATMRMGGGEAPPMGGGMPPQPPGMGMGGGGVPPIQ